MSQFKTCLLFFIFFALLSCSKKDNEVVKGQINIINDNEEQGQRLNGEWEFYWNQLYTPRHFRTQKTVAPQYVQVPNSWTTYKSKTGEKYNQYGYATYRIVVHEQIKENTTGLFIPKIWCANKVWVNDSLVLERGKTSSSSKGFANLILEELIKIPPATTHKIVVQVTNYNLFIAGIIQPFRIGQYERLNDLRDISSMQSLMWIGAVLIMGLYHFVLFFFRRQTYTTLYFAIICLLIVIKSTVFGNHFLYEYLKTHAGLLSFNAQASLYYVTTYMLVAVGMVYVRQLFPEETSSKISKTLMILTSLYCLFVLAVQPEIFSPTIMIFQAVIIVGVLYIFYVIVLATIHKQKSSKLMMIGMGIMVLAGINDGLHSLGLDLVGQQELIPTSFGVFLAIQLIVIAKRFSLAFKQVEDLSINLEKKVVERTAEVVKQKEEIEEKNKHITASIAYAQRIQEAILPSSFTQKNIFKDHFILFKPRDVVSGDFYFFDEIKNNFIDLKFLAAIDCTGHGVPGAFMSMIGNTMLNKIIHDKAIYDPAEILKILDDEVREALKQDENENRDGMDAAFIVFDNKTNELHFSGAANPLILIQNNELNLVKGDKHHIGGLHDDPDFRFKKHTFKIEEPTTLYLYSDGYQDQFGGHQGKKFMTKKFRELLFEHHEKPLNKQKTIFENTLEEWMGTEYEQVDDILLIGVKMGESTTELL